MHSADQARNTCQKLADSSIQNHQDEFADLTKIFVSLPAEKMDGQPAYRKSCDQLEIVILNDPDVGLPYGRLPRLIVSYLCREAKRTGERRVFVGDTLEEFAAMLGVTTTGGDLNRLGSQRLRLFTSRITITEKDNNSIKWRHIQIADNGDVLFGHHDPSLIVHECAFNCDWPSYINLSEPFARVCINHAAPVDMNTIRNLSGPMAIDVYIWLTYRYCNLGDPMTMNWRHLKWLFGDAFANSNQGHVNFKSKFREILVEITNYYPDAIFSVDDARWVTLLPSPRLHI